jgi:hypothetical protein
MVSEDSQFLNASMISSSLRRRFPPRFIGALNMRASSMPETERCRPDKTSSVTLRKTSRSTVALSTDWDVEASLTVDESRDPVTQVIWDSIKPVRGTGPFLLIVRTGRIFTAHATTETNGCDRTSTAGYSEFPAFSRVCFKGLLP